MLLASTGGKGDNSLVDAPVQSLVDDNSREISRLCAELAVRELRLFGSAVAGTFEPSQSDVDVLVEFFEPEAPGIADRYMSLAVGLESIFQRPVDLVTKQAMKNPVFRRNVENTSELLYAA